MAREQERTPRIHPTQVRVLPRHEDMVNPYESLSIDEFISEIKKEYENIISYVKISSKTGENIKTAFEILTEKLSF